MEAENNFLLESLAACDKSKTNMDLVMYFTINFAFVNYFDNFVESLDVHVLKLDNPGTDFTHITRKL